VTVLTGAAFLNNPPTRIAFDGRRERGADNLSYRMPGTFSVPQSVRYSPSPPSPVHRSKAHLYTRLVQRPGFGHPAVNLSLCPDTGGPICARGMLIHRFKPRPGPRPSKSKKNARPPWRAGPASCSYILFVLTNEPSSSLFKSFGAPAT